MDRDPFIELTCLSDADLASFLRERVEVRAVVALPSVYSPLADALIEALEKLKGRIAVVIDPHEDVYRLGYGDFAAVSLLEEKGVPLLRRSGLRLGCVLLDDAAFFLAPVPCLVEAEPEWAANRINAVPTSASHAEAYLRGIAEHPALDHALVGPKETMPSEQKAELVRPDELKIVKANLEEAPPANFPLARQTRVFSAYLQYVELQLLGCDLGSRKYVIPPGALPVDPGGKLKDKVETRVTLVPEFSKTLLASVDTRVNDLRKHVCKNLGQPYGRVLLKSSKAAFEKEVAQITKDLKEAKDKVEAELGKHLTDSMEAVVQFCLPHAVATPPRQLVILEPDPSPDQIERFVRSTIERDFPKASDLVGNMELRVHYKDMTFETLNEGEFITKLQTAYPHRDWAKTYQESLAVKAVPPGPREDEFPF